MRVPCSWSSQGPYISGSVIPIKYMVQRDNMWQCFLKILTEPSIQLQAASNACTHPSPRLLQPISALQTTLTPPNNPYGAVVSILDFQGSLIETLQRPEFKPPCGCWYLPFCVQLYANEGQALYKEPSKEYAIHVSQASGCIMEERSCIRSLNI